jgi:NDP-sugar pyrophosphorylase family protein
MTTPPLEGFLLAAGLGTRMGALSACLPKPAWTLRDRPLLQWGAEALRRGGAGRLGCNAHLHPERLRAVADGLEVFDEPRLLGSAGGLLHARGRVAAELLVWNADIWAEAVPFDRLRAAHRALAGDAAAAVTWLLVPHPGGPWNPVWLDDRDRILPKGVTGSRGPFHFTGAAAWSPGALALLPEGPSEMDDLRPHLAPHLGVVVEPFPWREIGTPEALLQAAAELAPGQEGRLSGCYVHPSAVPGGRLTRCVLGPGAVPPPSITDTDALWFAAGGNQVRLGL